MAACLNVWKLVTWLAAGGELLFVDANRRHCSWSLVKQSTASRTADAYNQTMIKQSIIVSLINQSINQITKKRLNTPQPMVYKNTQKT